MPTDHARHFDCDALLKAVQQQDLGIRVSTNHPAGFKRILYSAMRATPELTCHIYHDPRSPSAFLLLKRPIETLTPAEEPTHET